MASTSRHKLAGLYEVYVACSTSCGGKLDAILSRTRLSADRAIPETIHLAQPPGRSIITGATHRCKLKHPAHERSIAKGRAIVASLPE